MLQELHNVRYFDVFEFNAVKKYWACFMCNHPEKMSELMPDGHPVIAVCITSFTPTYLDSVSPPYLLYVLNKSIGAATDKSLALYSGVSDWIRGFSSL